MKILIVFTGGTIGSSKKGEIISPDSNCEYTLLDMYKTLNDKVDFVTVCPYMILSENLCGNNLNMLYSCIGSYNIDDYDGIIVTHGTDTLQYTSAFLGYAFCNIKKPVVVVSANYPLEDRRSNGLANFEAAVDFIRSYDGGGVFVAYTNNCENSKIHRATRLLAHMTYSDDVYSIFNEYYGEIVAGCFVKNPEYKEAENRLNFDGFVRLSERSDVIKLNAYAAMSYPDITTAAKAVLIEGYHSGTLNTDSEIFAKFCQKARSLNVPIFLTGACKGFNYESKLLFDRLNIRVLPPASPIAMYIKLWMLEKEKIEDVYFSCSDDFVLC